MSDTIVFFAKENITSKDIDDAINKLGLSTDLTISFERNAVVSDEIMFKKLPIESQRSADFLKEVFYAISRIKTKIKSKFTQTLVEISRYQLYDRNRAKVYKSWVLEKLVSQYEFHNIYWIEEEANLELEPKSFNMNNATVHMLLSEKPTSKYDDPVRNVYNLIRKIVGLVRYKRQFDTNSTLNDLKNKNILFAENYSNSAKISLQITELISNESSVGVLGLRNEVTKTLPQSKIIFNLNDVLPLPILVYAATLELLTYFWLYTRLVLLKRSSNEGIIESLTDILFVRELSQAVYYVTLCKRITEKSSFKIIASTTLSALPVRALMFAAKSKGIKTGFIQHGLNADFGVIKEYLLQEHFFLWGKHDADMFEIGGVNREQIYITGSPKFDNVLENNLKTTPTTSQKEVLNVVYFPARVGGAGVSKQESIEMLNWVKELTQLDNVKLSIKPHPVDLSDFFQNISQPITVLDSKSNAMDLLQSADLVITSTSNMGIEACKMGRALIILKSKGNPPSFPYFKYNAAIYADDSKELIEGVRLIMTDQKTRRQLQTGCDQLAEHTFYKNENSATQSIINILRTMI